MELREVAIPVGSHPESSDDEDPIRRLSKRRRQVELLEECMLQITSRQGPMIPDADLRSESVIFESRDHDRIRVEVQG